MKRKRLNRDGWGFMYYPYYQMRVDDDLFHGMACVIRFTDGEANYWQTPKAGRIQVTGAGMTWMQLVPDDSSHVITVKYFPDGTHDSERKNYPVTSNPKYQPSIWYVDIIDGIEYDEDGVAFFIDKYLDVIFTPEGDIKVDDRDELDEAYVLGDINKEQYEAALREADLVLEKFTVDISKTEEWSAKIRRIVESRIANGEPELISREKKALEEKRQLQKPSDMS